MLKDIFAGEVGGRVLNAGFAASGGNIFFAGDDGAHGLELWKSDGTSENTAMVKDVVPGWTEQSYRAQSS